MTGLQDGACGRAGLNELTAAMAAAVTLHRTSPWTGGVSGDAGAGGEQAPVGPGSASVENDCLLTTVHSTPGGDWSLVAAPQEPCPRGGMLVVVPTGCSSSEGATACQVPRGNVSLRIVPSAVPQPSGAHSWPGRWVVTAVEVLMHDGPG